MVYHPLPNSMAPKLQLPHEQRYPIPNVHVGGNYVQERGCVGIMYMRGDVPEPCVNVLTYLCERPSCFGRRPDLTVRMLIVCMYANNSTVLRMTDHYAPIVQVCNSIFCWTKWIQLD